MRVQAQELAQLTVAATPEPEGFDAGEETALLFIESCRRE